MKLQEQMFGLIAEWYSSKLFKTDFLADKNITQGKFDYWLKKYHSPKSSSTDSTPITGVENFKEIVLPAIEIAPSEKSETTVILELNTGSGLQIKIYDKC
jgi:hypothetical protein